MIMKKILTEWSAATIVVVESIALITLTCVVVNVRTSYTRLLTAAVVVVARIQRCQHKYNIVK